MASWVVRTLPATLSDELALRMLVTASSEMTTSRISAMIKTTPRSAWRWHGCNGVTKWRRTDAGRAGVVIMMGLWFWR